MDEIQTTFKFKNNKVKTPDGYLGASLSYTQFQGTKKLAKVHQALPPKCDTPFASNYRPELDETDELNKEDVTYYQELIGILRWAVELGRIDIALEVSMLSTHLALPRQGHLQAAFHIFAYLSKHYKQSMYINPKYHQWSDTIFPKYDWTDFYKDAKEEIPDDIPEPLGKPMEITCFEDADHAANKKT
jgi:hypothetical protein